MQITRFLDRSQATDAFRAAVRQFLQESRPVDRIDFDLRCPPVKIERTLTKILEEHPELPIERVSIEGRSGCEFFRGTATVHAAGEERRFSFYWDCRWRAEQEGWKDYFGIPDQARAAREFGHDCFRSWEEEAVPEEAAQTS